MKVGEAVSCGLQVQLIDGDQRSWTLVTFGLWSC